MPSASSTEPSAFLNTPFSRVDRMDLHAAVGRARDARVLAREEAILVERDVGAGAADDRVFGGEREALAIGAVAIDEHGARPTRARRDDGAAAARASARARGGDDELGGRIGDDAAAPATRASRLAASTRAAATIDAAARSSADVDAASRRRPDRSARLD